MEWLEKIQKIVLSNLIIFNFSAEKIFQEKNGKSFSFFLLLAGNKCFVLEKLLAEN
jgi:hypothetical protein